MNMENKIKYNLEKLSNGNYRIRISEPDAADFYLKERWIGSQLG